MIGVPVHRKRVGWASKPGNEEPLKVNTALRSWVAVKATSKAELGKKRKKRQVET